LDENIVKKYEKEINDGYNPCALVVSTAYQHCTMDYVYDKYNDQMMIGHMYMISYIIDGHHKIRAAANVGKHIRILNFVFGYLHQYLKKEDIDEKILLVSKAIID